MTPFQGVEKGSIPLFAAIFSVNTHMQEEISSVEYKKALALIEAFKAQEQGIPKQSEMPNFVYLVETTNKYIDYLKRGKISDDDFKEEIFVAAMESVFGSNLWVWVRKHTKTRHTLDI